MNSPLDTKHIDQKVFAMGLGHLISLIWLESSDSNEIVEIGHFKKEVIRKPETLKTYQVMLGLGLRVSCRWSVPDRPTPKTTIIRSRRVLWFLSRSGSRSKKEQESQLKKQ